MEGSCDRDSPECQCPCGCGCQNDPEGMDLPFRDKLNGETIPFYKVGLCASCAEGQHEIAPENCSPVADLISLHESVLSQLRCIQAYRKVSETEDEDTKLDYIVLSQAGALVTYGSQAACLAYASAGKDLIVKSRINHYS